MKRYVKMSAEKFLSNLPSLLENGYKGEMYTICISERFFNKIRKVMHRGANEELTNLYIFCHGYVLDPREQRNSGIYLRGHGDHYEVIMCRLHKPFLSGEDLLAMTAMEGIDSEEILPEGKEANDEKLVFQSNASHYMKLYFI